MRLCIISCAPDVSTPGFNLASKTLQTFKHTQSRAEAPEHLIECFEGVSELLLASREPAGVFQSCEAENKHVKCN